MLMAVTDVHRLAGHLLEAFAPLAA